MGRPDEFPFHHPGRLTTTEVCTLGRFSKGTLWRRIKAGTMPRPPTDARGRRSPRKARIGPSRGSGGVVRAVRRWWACTGLLGALWAMPALADPCEAPLPTRKGASFSGPVEYVGDGDGMCVRTSRGLVEVRLADFDAPERGEPGWREARGHLRALALRRWTVCTVTVGRNGRTTSFDRVLAVCRISGRRLGDLMRGRGAPEGGR